MPRAARTSIRFHRLAVPLPDPSPDQSHLSNESWIGSKELFFSGEKLQTILLLLPYPLNHHDPKPFFTKRFSILLIGISSLLVGRVERILFQVYFDQRTNSYLCTKYNKQEITMSLGGVTHKPEPSQVYMDVLISWDSGGPLSTRKKHRTPSQSNRPKESSRSWVRSKSLCHTR